jgi:hypothetical protein
MVIFMGWQQRLVEELSNVDAARGGGNGVGSEGGRRNIGTNVHNDGTALSNSSPSIQTNPSLPSSLSSLAMLLPTSLDFINDSDLRQHDYFSDSWLLNQRRFLDIDTSKILIVEGAVFAALGLSPQVHPYSKMLKDWTAFSVEHMSHWWKLFSVTSSDPFQLMGHIESNVFRSHVDKVAAAASAAIGIPPSATALQKTIAMVAFAPYKASPDPTGEKGVSYTAHSLASTVASLYRAGFGRVVIVGLDKDDMKSVGRSCDILIDVFRQRNVRAERVAQDDNVIAIIGNKMEIAYVRFTNKRIYSTPFIEKNVPRAAVCGMQMAMNGKMSPSEVEKWLGKDRSPAYWEYVYLTEPDTILQIKTELLPLFKQALDDGYSLFPHRLQPLPHELDLPADHSVDRSLYLPNVGHFANVTELDTVNGHSCCDGGPMWPGVQDFDNCRGKFWYTCDFGSKESTSVESRFKRFTVYPMMRLKEGTGVVWASTEQGRRCFPSRTSCS